MYRKISDINLNENRVFFFHNLPTNAISAIKISKIGGICNCFFTFLCGIINY